MNLYITEEAINELKNVIKSNDLKENVYVRVGIQGGGCSGFTHVLEFDDVLPSETDIKFEENGVRFVCDNKSSLYLEGATLDYIKNTFDSGFKFNIPNSKSCGCSKSFSV